jgi:DNA polymerase II small subunit
VNKEAVKMLTKQGCMVGKDAAEIIEEEDIERIKELDATPMYISGDMLTQIREKVSQKVVVNSQGGTEVENPEPVEPQQEAAQEQADQNPKEEDSAGAEASEVGQPASEVEEPSDDVEYGRKSSYFDHERTVVVRDDGSRDGMETKVEVMDDYEVSRSEKDVPEFLQYYNDRYDKMKKLLMRRSELKSATSVERLKRRDEGDEAATIGMVKDMYSTNSGKYIVSLEDKTGTFKVLVDERDGDRLVEDEMIGVNGSMGGDILYANSVIRPDLPIPDGVNTTKEDVEAAYISDFHMGSKDTLKKRLDRFAEWLGTEEASNIGYLVIPGDVVEGVGVYPDQDQELEVMDIYKQYHRFEEWVEKVPDDIQILLGPGNHDITRLAEPQPKIDEDVFDRIHEFNNVHLVRNPQTVRLHGIRSKGITNLMYHGYSFDDQIDAIKELRENAYDEPYRVMVDLLKRRHLAPTYGSNLLSPEAEDHLVIDEKPDVFVAGHLHSHSNYSYKGVNVIASSTFQAQTDFQKRVGHEPDPGKVTIVNFGNRNTEVKQF